MRTLPGDYLAAAKAAGRYPNIKVIISGAETITGNGAVSECHIMQGDSAKPAYFETALALSSECRITIDRRWLNNESAIVSGAKIQVYAAFDNSTGQEISSAKLGTFYITSYDKSDNIRGIITASDRMLYAGVDFNPEGITYPATIETIFAEAWNQSGLSNVDTQLDINPKVWNAIYKAETPIAEGMNGDPYTCRDVLARIAGMNLGALYLDADEVPQIYKYDTGSINDANILDIRIGSETFYIQQVLVYKTEERMAKKGSGYRQLPYAPRFDNMDYIEEGTPWIAEIRAASTKIRNKPWTTATVTIQGVGEIEPGDFVTAAGTTLLVTGISYDFVYAHFTETLYSYAFTEEEYYMAPQKTVNVSTGTEKKSGGGVGENVGDHNERFNGYVNGTDGHIIRSGDYNHAEGFKNTIQSESYSHAEGYQNTAQGGNYNHIEGDYNTLTASNRAHVGGFRNTVTGASCSIVSGYMNIASGSISYDIISGVSNEVYNVDRAIVIGDSNFVAAISSAIVCGQYADTRTITTPDNGDLRFLIGGSQALGNVLYITHKGNVYARGSYNSTGADYAEYFEWADGNPDNEYRCGMLVSLDGDKITLAHGDDIFGIISANPSVIGNNPIEWHGKYKRDVFGSLVLDENGEPILNPDYDPEKQYIPREQRPEWVAVGIVGKLIIVDNGTCKPNGYVSARNGIGTASLSPTNIRVLQRVDDKHVEVFIK